MAAGPRRRRGWRGAQGGRKKGETGKSSAAERQVGTEAAATAAAEDEDEDEEEEDQCHIVAKS